MALNARFLGFDTAAQGDWLGNRGSLGYFMFGSTNRIAGSICTSVGRHPTSGGVSPTQSPAAATERRSLLLPDGSARSPYYFRDNDAAFPDRHWRYQCNATPDWITASVYLCNFSFNPVPAAVWLIEGTTGGYVAQYTYPGDYQQGVWIRFAARATGQWRIVIPHDVASSGAFFDPYFQHYVGGANQYFVGHGVF